MPNGSRNGRLPHAVKRGALIDPTERYVRAVEADGQLSLVEGPGLTNRFDTSVARAVQAGEEGIVTLLGRSPQLATGRFALRDVAVLSAILQELHHDLPEPGRFATVKTSIGELTAQVFGKNVGGAQYAEIKESLLRLLWTQFTIPGLDLQGNRSEDGHLIGVRCLGGVRWFGRDLAVGFSADPSEVGRAVANLPNYDTLEIVVEPWLAGCLRNQQAARIDLGYLQLLGRGLSGRLWLYLEGENYRRCADAGDGEFGATYIDLAAPAMATLGLSGYKQRAAALRDLRNACGRITYLDAGYRRVQVVSVGRGRFRLIAERYTDARSRRSELRVDQLTAQERNDLRKQADAEVAAARKAAKQIPKTTTRRNRP